MGDPDWNPTHSDREQTLQDTSVFLLRMTNNTRGKWNQTASLLLHQVSAEAQRTSSLLINRRFKGEKTSALLQKMI